MSPAMALRIEAWLGVERGGRADIWLAGQVAYDLWQAHQNSGKLRVKPCSGRKRPLMAYKAM